MGYEWWKFGGYNMQALYGYGTRREADIFAEALNAGRECNLYYVSETTAAERRALNSEDNNEGFNLYDTLTS